ncbi:hypothetical protein D9757_000926 [Collybiopsis confluens]|uniref:Hydrophobin n=1 Tax=Collybiopsis confluens TaxID=2823264 RepID=A0A8H5I092_9AGAR|nr:hypothetical protein D9757_000926 [Collybiopsis confluens]
MKVTSVFTVALAAAAGVAASPFKETNGERLARGLPPLPPTRRSGTPAYAAKRTTPSGSPGSCSTGPIQCCNTVGTNSNPVISLLLGLLGIVVQDVNALIGATCSPAILGIGSAGCAAQAVCCQDNSHGGLISIGCVPVQL